MRLGLLMIFGLLAAPAEAETVPLQPTGKWIVNFADAECSASRAFGTTDKPFDFLIKPSPTSDVVQIALVKKGREMSGIQERATLRFGAKPPVKLKLLEYGFGKTNVRLINLDGSLAAAMAQESTIEWSGDAGRTKLQTGSLRAVMKTLAKCRDGLRDIWNISDAKQAMLKARARADIYKFFKSEDYPAQAVQQDDSGITSVVLLVDEKGKIRECMVDGTSGIPTLDAMTCIVLHERGKFEPAIGPDGKPARDGVTARIRWEMP